MSLKEISEKLQRLLGDDEVDAQTEIGGRSYKERFIERESF